MSKNNPTYKTLSGKKVRSTPETSYGTTIGNALKPVYQKPVTVANMNRRTKRANFKTFQTLSVKQAKQDTLKVLDRFPMIGSDKAVEVFERKLATQKFKLFSSTPPVESNDDVSQGESDE